MGNVWKYVKAQKNANKVGPLGKRAGMDASMKTSTLSSVWKCLAAEESIPMSVKEILKQT